MTYKRKPANGSMDDGNKYLEYLRKRAPNYDANYRCAISAQMETFYEQVHAGSEEHDYSGSDAKSDGERRISFASVTRVDPLRCSA